ncbi:MAG TPA: lytic transglycosylase domain-containing protein [Steroidobacteraceae bacterium]|nr:lytic transglycosylase domain-containing protein [Steroidobacteraceae bacterium]
MRWWPKSGAGWAARLAALALLLAGAGPAVCAQDQAQRDPELRAIVGQAISTARCFADKYDSAVWYALMEPRLRNIVKDAGERMRILETAFCEAHRPGEQRLPPGLIMAVIDIESRFDRWAVSSAGAVGLMQIMPFWPAELGMKRHQLVEIEANMRMGCAILRHYLQREKNDVRKALARYNGSVGRRQYPDLVVQRWTGRWHGADDLGVPATARR